MNRSCKIAVLLSDADGNILLLPVRVIPCLKCTTLGVNYPPLSGERVNYDVIYGIFTSQHVIDG